MRLRTRQRGWIPYPVEGLGILFALAAIGILALVALAGFGVWWVLANVRLVFL